MRKANAMKTGLVLSLLAVAVSSTAAFANRDCHHHRHQIAYSRSHDGSRDFTGNEQPAPSRIDPFGTYSVLPSPVSDQ